MQQILSNDTLIPLRHSYGNRLLQAQASISEPCWGEVDAIELGLGSSLSWQSVSCASVTLILEPFSQG